MYSIPPFSLIFYCLIPCMSLLSFLLQYMAFGGGGKEVEESLFLYNSIYVIYKPVLCVLYLPSAKITLADCYTVQILIDRGCSQSLADSAKSGPLDSKCLSTTFHVLPRLEGYCNVRRNYLFFCSKIVIILYTQIRIPPVLNLQDYSAA